MRVAALFSLALLSLPLAGCYGDPFQDPNQWALTGASRESLAQQVANKDDLLQGRGETTSNGVAASAAIDTALGGAAGNATGLQKPPVAITFSSGTGS